VQSLFGMDSGTTLQGCPHERIYCDSNKPFSTTVY